MSHDPDTFDAHQLEVLIADEIAHVEASLADELLVDFDSGWGLNPSEARAYEARLRSLRGAVIALEVADGASSPPLLRPVTASGRHHNDLIRRQQ